MASGAKSLISGERLSVRLPSRMVAICVSDPMGLEYPRRMLSTPAMNVVATAPSPGVSTPNFPVAGRGAWRVSEDEPCTTLISFEQGTRVEGSRRRCGFRYRRLVDRRRGVRGRCGRGTRKPHAGTTVIQAVTVRITMMIARTTPCSVNPKNAWGTESSTTRSGRCSIPTLASMPRASARARVYEVRKAPMRPSRQTTTIGTLAHE